MKSVLVGMMLASVFIVPAKAGGSGSVPAASSSSTATGGAGGTGGSAAGGSATGGSATGGQSNGNTSTISVSLTTDNSSGSGTSGGSANGAASGATGDPSAAGGPNVQYSGSYTVKSAPPVVAPSLTSTFSDTCMGSASFGLSFVGFGATGGTTMVDEACVRRLDSREFRAMGLNDVALALLCQSAANRAAVEATGRACPSAAAKGDTASVASTITLSKAADRSTVAPVEKQIEKQVAPIAVTEAPQVSQPINVANTDAKPMEVLSTEPVEIKPLPEELNEGK